MVFDDTTNSDETITVTNGTGISDVAIKLQSTVGGINFTTANSIISLETDGDIINQYQNNKSYTIKNTENNVSMVFDDITNSDETITVTNGTGTSDVAIKLQSTVGGINMTTANSVISLETDGDIRIDTNSNERLTILSNGNVGINNINPQNQLHIVGRVSATDYIGIWNGDTVATNRGGTGFGYTNTYTNGQLLIGKTDGTLNKRVLEAGNNINIVNDDGMITISATGNEGAVGEEIYWNSPPFISNNISDTYEKMNIAYQNMDTGFQTYIIPYNVRITKILIIQTEETAESYSIKILSNSNQKSITNIIIDANKTKRVPVSTNGGDLILADEKLEIEIIDNNGTGNITGEEVLVILEGHYEGIRVGSMWVKLNSDIYYKTGGNVGVNTETPNYNLDVAGNINFTGNLFKNGVQQTFEGVSSPEKGDMLYYDGYDWIKTKGPVYYYIITSVGNTAYRFNGPGINSNENNPNFTFYRGCTYIFENTSTHNFSLRISLINSNSPSELIITGSQSGIQYVEVPYNHSYIKLIYQCVDHSSMYANIYMDSPIINTLNDKIELLESYHQ